MALLCPALAPTPLANVPAGVATPIPAPIEVFVPVASDPAAAVPVDAAAVAVRTAPILNPAPKATEFEAADAGAAIIETKAALRKSFFIWSYPLILPWWWEFYRFS
jgi:hypothetical protein